LNFNLSMLNLWIGMCRGVSGLPGSLKALGYSDRYIEHRFQNDKREPVQPDLIISSEKINHTLLLEFKSGANTDEDQLKRYSNITKQNLVDQAYISRSAAVNHDVAIVGLDEFRERLKIGIDNVGYPFPLLVKNKEGLALDYNEFSVILLNSIFAPVLEIDWDKISTRFVPLDKESEPWEIAEVVIPKIMQFMTERRPRISLEELCQAVCETWGIMSSPGREDFQKKVREVLKEASYSNFSSYIKWNRSPEGVEIIGNPLELDTDKRSGAYRKLLTAQKNFLEKLKTGLTGMQQLPLFPK
jgi:hypothetical protein